MSGRRGTQIISVAMALAIAWCSLPVHAMAGNQPETVSNTPSKSLQAGSLSAGFLRTQPEMSALRPMASMPDQTSPAYAFQQIDDSDSRNSTPSQTLQGAVTSIHVTQGRSQIVKFAQPIARMSIAQPEIADLIPLSPDQLMINGKVRGVTSLIVWDENGQEGIFDLYVQKDSTEVLDAVAAIAPNEKIQARVTDDSFILTGQVSSSVVLDQIRQIAAAYGYPDADGDATKDKFKDLTETPVPQVMLEVKIAEANRSVVRDFRSGIALDDPVGQGTAFVFSRFDAPIPTDDPDGPAPIGSLQKLKNPSVGGLTAVFGKSNFLGTGRNALARLDALDTKGKVNILANPTLVCTHGRTASFLAGGEFPFVSAVDQNGSPIIAFKDYGVKLNFTPWISMKTGRIELRVQPEVSSLDRNNCVTGASSTQVCGLLKRETQTTVQLKNGETLMISGILSREEQNSFAQTPFIGDVPILGMFFKNGIMNKIDRELVVIITPHIVSPSDEGRILGAAP